GGDSGSMWGVRDKNGGRGGGLKTPLGRRGGGGVDSAPGGLGGGGGGGGIWGGGADVLGFGKRPRNAASSLGGGSFTSFNSEERNVGCCPSVAGGERASA